MNGSHDQAPNLHTGDRTPSRRRESAGIAPDTARAREILDEVALRIVEIRVALMTAAEHAPLRLDDFHPLLTDLELLADQAVGAAGMLRNDELEGSADPRTFPSPSSLHEFNRALTAVGDRATAAALAARPQCPATGPGAQQCGNDALYLGVNTVASGCYLHASDDELRRYRQHHDNRDETDVSAEHLEHRALVDLGHRITDDWLQRRDEPDSLHRLINRPGGPFNSGPADETARDRDHG